MNLLERIKRQHGMPALKLSALKLPGAEETFRQVLAGKGYCTVLEIGTFKGCSAAAVAQYCERVVTIDLKAGRLERDAPDFDRQAFWASLGIGNIEFIAVADDAEKADVIDGIEFDLAFIDGAHDGESVRRDFDLVKKCGRVLFHDYDNSGHASSRQIFDFVNSLPPEQIGIMGIFALWEKPL